VKLRVGIPMYGGMACSNHQRSRLEFENLCRKAGVGCTLTQLDQESLIPRARNKIASIFMASDDTHLLFWDADIGVDVGDLWHMLQWAQKPGYDLIGGIYPKKTINWEAVKRTVLANPEVTPEQLTAAAGVFVFNLAGDNSEEQQTKTIQIGQPLDVIEVGSGLMCISRKVFETMQEVYPDSWYKPVDGDTGGLKTDKMWDYFMNGIYQTYGTQAYLSEDYGFCQKWGSIPGNKVWLAPWVRSTHRGVYDFVGDMRMAAVASKGKVDVTGDGGKDGTDH